MSDGRNKLGDLGQLKSLVKSGFKGLKEKTERFRSKAEAAAAENDSKPSSEPSHQDSPKSNQNPKRQHQQRNRRPQTRMEKESTRNTFQMPQYGQKVNMQEDFDQLNGEQDEIVIAVDVNRQTQMDERRLFGWLCKRFPKCFNPKSKKPLKIGISDDIEVMYKNETQMDVDQEALRRTLRRYVGDQNYQRSILVHKARFDLKGNKVEEMTPEHVAHAEARLAELKEKAEFRKQGGTNAEFYEMKRKEREAQEAAKGSEDQEQEEAAQDQVDTVDVEVQAEAVDENVQQTSEVAEEAPEVQLAEEPIQEEAGQTVEISEEAAKKDEQ